MKVLDDNTTGEWGGGGGAGAESFQYSTAVLSICLLLYLTFEQVPAAM